MVARVSDMGAPDRRAHVTIRDGDRQCHMSGASLGKPQRVATSERKSCPRSVKALAHHMQFRRTFTAANLSISLSASGVDKAGAAGSGKEWRWCVALAGATSL